MLPSMRLGASDIDLRPIGLGTQTWTDKADPESLDDIAGAYAATLDAGITLVDTAEMYGRGGSERVIRDTRRKLDRGCFIATKYFPYPNRVRSSALPKALNKSRRNLGKKVIDLYQVHWPFGLVRIPALMDRMAGAVEAGTIRTVGVSNYSASQLRRAHEALALHGIPLVSNQVHYSLLHRKPETDGVLEACRELDITLIAYYPLESGLLTAKFRENGNRPTGSRRFRGHFRHLDRLEPLFQQLETIGETHGRTAGQVALNWLARQENVLPIPGARNAQQAAANAAAIDFTITDDEVALLTAAVDALA